MKETPIIALLTDFGLEDTYVASMKGVIYTLNPEAKIVDITHQIAPQSIKEASFKLHHCYQDFPKGTFFVVVVDPGVGSDRKPILLESDGYYFIGPDNGLFTPFLPQSKSCYQLNDSKCLRPPASNTFHGRDIFAPSAAWLSLRKDFDLLPSLPIQSLVQLEELECKKVTPHLIKGEYLYADHFGNIITNIPGTEIKEGSILQIENDSYPIHPNYQSAEEEVPFGIIGSAGFLEISVKNGSAWSFFNRPAKMELKIKLPG